MPDTISDCGYLSHDGDIQRFYRKIPFDHAVVIYFVLQMATCSLKVRNRVWQRYVVVGLAQVKSCYTLWSS